MFNYKINQISTSLIIFAEENKPLHERGKLTPHVNSAALVIGTEYAAMIDTGDGKGDLLAEIRKYTKLPVIVLITHGDSDHCGACGQFTGSKIYMSKLDDELTLNNPFPHEDIKDGQIFDLGGIMLEAIAVPGHSRGSVCFLDRKNNNLYSGDGVNKLPFLFLERCTVLSVYKASLERLRDMTDEKPDIYCGHSLTAYPYQVLLDSITACDDVLSGKTNTDLPYSMPFEADSPIIPNVFEHQVGDVRLIYNNQML